MNDAANSCRVDRGQAEQFQVRHLVGLGGPQRSDYRFHRAAIRRFLTGLCQADDESAGSQLILSEQRLLDWLIQEARRRTTASAGCCFAAVSRYVREMVRHGLLETDGMAAFQARYGNRGWPILAGALQSPDPVAALTLLQWFRPARTDRTARTTLPGTPRRDRKELPAEPMPSDTPGSLPEKAGHRQRPSHHIRVDRALGGDHQW